MSRTSREVSEDNWELMRRTFRHALQSSCVAFALLGFACSALAGFDEGMAAYKRKDYETAAREWQPLAAQGDPRAQYEMGVLHFQGWGVARDLDKALAYYRQAAEQGQSGALHNLGVMYGRGLGVTQDDKQALSYFRRAAQAGNVESMFVIGSYLEDGRGGVEVDYAEAAKWFRKSAEQGYFRAQNRLGLALWQGRGIERNETEAAHWIGRSAKQGWAAAQMGYARMYQTGAGVPQDRSEAYFWYSLALPRITNLAERDIVLGELRTAAASMTPKELQDAEKRVRAWKPKFEMMYEPGP